MVRYGTTPMQAIQAAAKVAAQARGIEKTVGHSHGAARQASSP
jgi:imidazolonepropionase-like amidohydrolase